MVLGELEEMSSVIGRSLDPHRKLGLMWKECTVDEDLLDVRY